MLRRFLLLPILLLAPSGIVPTAETLQTPPPSVQPKAVDPLYASATYSGLLRPRPIGPALFSGRISGLAIHPRNPAHYYVAVASGGVWKTTNAGTTWTPLFDSQGSYSIGAIAIDPKDPQILWVGTGENNSQRSVGYGDGVYRSTDAGKTWAKVGLGLSEHIGKILLDPRDSNTVYVAAQGPLWDSGGDRGLYRTQDGGKTWSQLLKISPNTGVTDVVCDPRNPDVLLAAAWQRRRHVWTLINGGPESAIYRSTDAGKSWKKITAGLPTTDMGRIGLAVATSDPGTVYATVEAADGKGGIFRSVDGGQTWQKQNPFDSLGMYYGHLVVDPKNADRIFVMNTYIMTSIDAGKTLTRLPMRSMHVDCHCMWIDPADNDHYLVGCDGGIYESYDAAKTWRHIRNLPVMQFYDVTCDESGPFYHVYGGTQDNTTLGGPARTRSVHGITNADWFVVFGGDGFQCKVDPRDPNIVYGEAQYGELVRHDRRTGETVGIRPDAGKKEPPLRWNWDSPLLLSSHSPTRLYFAANRLFRTDDRGNTWKTISGDLTRQIDRNRLPVMGKVWGPEAVYKGGSTSLYGNLVALAESTKDENVLYVGSDDGLIQVTEDGGKTWKKIDKLPGVPPQTYIARLVTSRHDGDTVYAVCNNHKNGDFRPYLVRSMDRGKSWVSINGNLPTNHPLWAFAEDTVDPNLLFVGTEFGLYFSLDAGKNWIKVGGLPTIPVRDLAIQKQQNDLVIGTFGRGIYILDDYSPLRKLTAKVLKSPSLFSVRDALQYIPTRQYGGSRKPWMGDAFYQENNPPYGAEFTYHLPESLRTEKQKRLAAEKKDGVKSYPTPEQLRAEAAEEEPTVVLEISDEKGQPIQRLTAPATKGFHRVAWDMREPSPTLPTVSGDGEEGGRRAGSTGPMVLPGTYTVRLSLREKGVVRSVEGAEQKFRVVMSGTTVTADQRKELYTFQKEVNDLRGKLSATLAKITDTQQRLAKMRRAFDQTPTSTAEDRAKVLAVEAKLRELVRELQGDSVLRAKNENTPLSIAERIGTILGHQRNSLSPPTQTARTLYAEGKESLTEVISRLKAVETKEIPVLEKRLDAIGAPWTPGREVK